MRADLTLVVSPLVSLMQDQVEALERVAPGKVALVNAQQDAAANRGGARPRRVRRARGCSTSRPSASPRPGSSSGSGRRRSGCSWSTRRTASRSGATTSGPDYFRLADAARWLGAEAIVASTATATPQVADDIVARLGLRDPVRIATGFDRPNLSFAVVAVRDEGGGPPRDRRGAGRAGRAARRSSTRARARSATSSRRGSAHELGTTVLAYHAGLPRDARAEAQRRFMDGEVDVVVATNAFGMGVDKADVRTVCHEAVPGSIEAYYQEAGRAGRDGAPARCLLFASARDKGLHVFFIERSTVEEPALKAVARALTGAAAGDARRSPAARRRGSTCRSSSSPALAGCDEEVVRAIVGHLARVGRRPAQPVGARPRARPASPARGTAARSRCAGPRRRRARARAGASTASVWAWVEGVACRRAGILRHFGDRQAPAPDGPVLRRLRPVARPAAARAGRAAGGGGPRQLAQRPVAAGDTAALDEAIVEVVALARPVARAHARGRGAARRPLEGAAQARLGRAAALRHVRPPERAVGARARRRAARRPAR